MKKDGSTDPVKDGSTDPVKDGSTVPVKVGSTDPVKDGSTDPVVADSFSIRLALDLVEQLVQLRRAAPHFRRRRQGQRLVDCLLRFLGKKVKGRQIGRNMT